MQPIKNFHPPSLPPKTHLLSRLAERQVESVSARQGVNPVLERHHAVISQSRRSAPDQYIAMTDRDARRLVRPLFSPEQEGRWQTQRDRHNRLVEVTLVFVLVQCESGSRL